MIQLQKTKDFGFRRHNYDTVTGLRTRREVILNSGSEPNESLFPGVSPMGTEDYNNFSNRTTLLTNKKRLDTKRDKGIKVFVSNFTQILDHNSQRFEFKL